MLQNRHHFLRFWEDIVDFENIYSEIGNSCRFWKHFNVDKLDNTVFLDLLKGFISVCIKHFVIAFVPKFEKMGFKFDNIYIAAFVF